MNSRNRYNGMNVYAVQVIRFKACQLSNLPFFGSGDVEDLEQELAIDLHRRMPSFDSGRASLHTFIDMVVGNKAADLVVTAKTSRRYGGQAAISLEEILDSEHAEDAVLVVDSSAFLESGGSTDIEVAIDLGRCLRCLSREQQRLCFLLPFYEPSAISREMGWSRATFFRRVAGLREIFRKAGLGSFFVAA
ncbi:MAG: sigma-70 family RNA polymerase sigma factor [Magnetococcales bacterium]|nr:sigma-70 family RNA polymerase sigma factor [Magnetococcales bacterium]MBF0115629.1 sigma-70 family RNA polymerase sigma factor [Magnetococcales bacterium]